VSLQFVPQDNTSPSGWIAAHDLAQHDRAALGFIALGTSVREWSADIAAK
jgi:hypothetical protein